MIFVTVGTQFPFDRLISAIDAWAGRNKTERVIGQIGPSQYKPNHIEAYHFISPGRFQSFQSDAQLLVSHAGMGAILSALEGAKPLIIMPRKAGLGEHRNDHQLATAKHFRCISGIHVADEVEGLDQLLEKRLVLSGPSRIGAGASVELINALSRFLSDGIVPKDARVGRFEMPVKDGS